MRNLCEHGGAEHLPACRVDGAKRGGVNSHLVARIDLHRPSSASRSPHGREQTIHCMRLTVLAAAISSLSWLLHVHAAPAAEPVECGQWAAAGECTANPSYMQSHCARSCASAPTTTADRYSEPEQCAGWASNGECTRNPKYMLDTCPRNCAEQRASVVAGFLDEASRCIDEATKEKCTTSGFRKQCAGSCKVLALCEDETDPPECRRALRCRELKDDKEECAAKAKAEGCGMGSGSAGYLLRHCYLSCAEHDLAGLLGRFRAKISVRTRAHGFLDEEPPAAGVAPRSVEPLLPLPCWKGTPLDPRPPATCTSPRATLVHRWRRLGVASCAAQPQSGLRTAGKKDFHSGGEPRDPSDAGAVQQVPRVGRRRRVPLPSALAAEGRAGGHAVRVLPIVKSPKVRLVEEFVTADEAAHIIKVGLPRMSRSLAGGRQESIRTSTTAMLPAGDPVVKRITERASYLTGYPYANIEPLQLVKYTAGQRYEPHFDYGEACDFEENMGKGHRHVTMLVYLNNLPAGAGGHTTFPKLNVQVDPIEVRILARFRRNSGALLAHFWRNSGAIL